MKLRLLCICLLCSVIAYGQKDLKDSIAYYGRSLSDLRKKAMDSLYQSEEYRDLMKNLFRLKARTDDYTSFNIFYQAVSADFSAFNTSIVASGFPVLNETIHSIGIGFSNKKGRRVFDFTVASFGLRKRSKKNDEEISVSVSSLYHFDWGYDFVKSQQVNFFPYAGFGFRTSSISYDKPSQVNGSFTNISNLVINDQSVDASSVKFVLNAGIGFDLVLNTRNYGAGPMIYFKGGTSIPVGKEKYKIEGAPDYDPGIKYGRWTVTAGIKLFGR